MKKSFSSFAEVAHIWAQQLPKQGEARCRNGRYNGPDLYSYNACIGTFVNDNVVIISDYSYSSTTNRHIRDARRACSHKTILRSPRWISTNNLQTEVDFIVRHINEYSDASISAYREQKRWEWELQKYFKVDPTLTVPELKFCMTEEEVKKINDRANKAAETRNANAKVNDDPEKYKAFIEALKTKLSETGDPLEAWREFKTIPKTISYKYNGNTYKRSIPVCNYHLRWRQPELYGILSNVESFDKSVHHLRVSKDGNLIETSGRAKVDVRNAKILYDLLKLGHDIKEFHIGYYTVIGIDEDRIKIGCHNIPLSEVDYIAEKLNWNDRSKIC